MKKFSDLLILVFLFVLAATPLFAQQEEQFVRIPVDVVRDKIYGSWLGQMVGNIYGLPHENKYIDKAGPDAFPYGYTNNLERLKKTGGAFSDDDTDIEYIYLLQMGKHGPEPTYGQLAAAWKYHIRERVWLANRAALGLMHAGFDPPFTGMKEFNPHWFQIDPQLVNEIWGITAPAMVTYAAQKSAWAARITNDGWGIEPTVHYGAMFSAAFFESDVNKLIDIGVNALPKDSRFAKTVSYVKDLYKRYPNDWTQARKELAQRYYHDEPEETKTIWNANLNAACGILALLYGQGDFQRTLDLSCAMGFDADNQAATMSGLLGAVGGVSIIPKKLLYPIDGWQTPFNDLYKNVSRHDMPDARITEMTEKTLAQARALITNGGGSTVTENGREIFVINTRATFQPALEISAGPRPVLEVGGPAKELLALPQDAKWTVTNGALPTGITFSEGVLKGTPTSPGVYPVELEASSERGTARKKFNLLVRGANLSKDATKVISNISTPNATARDSMWLSVSPELYAPDVSIIRDGVRRGEGSVFYSIDGTHRPKEDYYGFQWREEQTIGMVSFSTGSMEENGGWFTTLNVEFQNARGEWQTVRDLVIAPTLITGDEPFNKPHFVEYLLSFDPVESKGIRIIGRPGASDHWYSKMTWFTSITELGVYAPVPDIKTVMVK